MLHQERKSSQTFPALLWRDCGFIATNLTMLLTERVGKRAQASANVAARSPAERVARNPGTRVEDSAEPTPARLIGSFDLMFPATA
jgi:hypothetical protein